jgi:hypothetical protein
MRETAYTYDSRINMTMKTKINSAESKICHKQCILKWLYYLYSVD